MRRIKMKKNYVLGLSVFLFIGLIISPILNPANAAPKKGWPKGIHITAPSKGPKYFAPLAFSGVLEEKTGMKVRIIPDEVHFQRLKAFREGEYDIYVQGSGGPLFFQQGVNEYAVKGNGPLPITVMWPAVIEPFSPMLRGDTKYKTIKDLKPGITFAAPPGAAPQANCYGVAAWAGLKDHEWKIIEFGSMGAAVNAIPDGKADIVWWIPDAGETYEAETKPKGLHWIDLNPKADPAGAERALEKCPNWMFGKAPGTSVKSAKGTNLALVATYFYVLEDMDEDLVYNMCKFIDENIDALKEKHPSAGTQSLESFKSILGGNFIPLHNGTIRYLKEKGIWTDADQKRQDFNKKVFNMYIKAFDKAVAEAESKKIKPVAGNKQWLDIWASNKKGIPRLKVRMEIPELP
jgi:TRAP transporter TAXI family solute receptor